MGNENKVCLITGATNGIGAVAAREIAKRGYRVVVSGRSPDRCAATVAAIQQEVNNPHVSYLVADLSAKSEAERLAREFRAKHDRLDVLVNNAGAVFFDRRTSADGLEMTFALNHMGYFTLTHHLIDLLMKSAPARIVNVSSGAHKGGSMNFDDLQIKSWGRGSGWKAYCQSKLANVHFTTELARRLAGTGVTANCLHPGVVSTNFGSDNGFWGWLIGMSFGLFGITAEDGARTIVYLATSPEVEGVTGKYFYKQKEASISTEGQDAAGAKRLWDVSAGLAGVAAA